MTDKQPGQVSNQSNPDSPQNSKLLSQRRCNQPPSLTSFVVTFCWILSTAPDVVFPRTNHTSVYSVIIFYLQYIQDSNHNTSWRVGQAITSLSHSTLSTLRQRLPQCQLSQRESTQVSESDNRCVIQLLYCALNCISPPLICCWCL